MHPRSLAALAVACLAAAGCASTGLDEPVPVDAATLKAAEGMFQQAEALRSKQQFDDARDTYRDMRDAYPGSPLAAEAQFLEAECAYADKSFTGAGELFAKFAEDRPFSRHLPIVEKRLFEIGQWLIEDGKRGFLGLGILSTSDQGIALLRRQQILLPTGNLSDDALYLVGRWYAEQNAYEDAQVVLQDLVRSYPSSEWRLAARFLLGWAYRNDNRGAEYDGEKLRRARAQYMEFVSAASSDPGRAAEYATKIEAAREAVDEIDGVLASKALARAKLYRRVGNDTAAVFVLRSAAARWGNTAPGQECARQADSLSREVQAAAVPAPAAVGPALNGGP